MSVPAAYAAVVIIWSTTPLSIAWSNESFDPVFAAFLRMSVATVLGFGLLKGLNIVLPWHKAAWRTYAASSIGIFGAVLCTYLAAAYVPSGLIAVIFGLTPMISGVAAHYILNEPALSSRKWIALAISVVGLTLICFDDVSVMAGAGIGISFLLLAVTLFSLSSVFVKKNSSDIHPFAITVGSLMVSVPCYLVCCLIMVDMSGNLQVLVEQVPEKSLSAILYLALVGSLVGFFAYHYVLKKLSAAVVALVTVITPVVALALGYLLNHETLAVPTLAGAALVLCGLCLFIRAPVAYAEGNT